MPTDESSAHGRVDSQRPPNGEIGYATLARRISGWTTNLLATAIVVLIAVLFGRQLVALWRPPQSFPTPQAENQLAAFDDPFTPLQLEFGNSPMVLHRQPFLGDLDAALQQLCQACAEQLKKLPLPASKAVPGAEAALLARVTKRPPLKLVPPDGALYQLDDSMPVIIGTKKGGGDAPIGSVGNSTERVVTWGIAVPGPDEGWTLYSFGTRGDEVYSESATPSSESIPLPPGAERILTMRWPGGGRVTAFRGVGEWDQWTQFFDDWFDERGAERTIAWRGQGDSRFARYLLPQGEKHLAVDIQFSTVTSGEPIGADRWRGLMTVTLDND